MSENLQEVAEALEHSADKLLQNPVPFYNKLRAQCPVYRAPGSDTYFISRYDDVVSASRDTDTFTNRGSRIEPEVEGQRYASISTIEKLDGPEHAHIRKALYAIFTPGRLRSYEPMIQSQADDLIDQFIHEPEIEFMKVFARPLPIRVIGSILGMPRDSFDQLSAWADDYLQLVNGWFDPGDEQHLLKSYGEFTNFCGDQVSDARKSPRRDGLSEIAHALAPDGQQYSVDALANNVRMLILGGNETTTSMFANALVFLLSDPTAIGDMDDRNYVVRMLEESLRLESPAAGSMRLCKRSVEMHGVTIPAGSHVRLMWAAANRDEAIFPDPDRFDPARGEVRASIAFAHGPHFCIGAPLARSEGYVVFRTLFSRFKEIRLSQKNDFRRIAKTTDPLSLRELGELHLELVPA